MPLAFDNTYRGSEPSARNHPELRFHYLSRMSGALPRADLARIVHASWWNNLRMGITGWLSFDGTCFEQVMEGRAEAISYVAASILADDRHESIDVRNFSLIDGRSHDSWVFEGFDAVLQEVNLPIEACDPTNVIRADFPNRR